MRQVVPDSAVRAAYGIKETEDLFPFHLRLKLELADKGAQGHLLTAPAPPAALPDKEQLVSHDRIQPPG